MYDYKKRLYKTHAIGNDLKLKDIHLKCKITKKLLLTPRYKPVFSTFALEMENRGFVTFDTTTSTLKDWETLNNRLKNQYNIDLKERIIGDALQNYYSKKIEGTDTFVIGKDEYYSKFKEFPWEECYTVTKNKPKNKPTFDQFMLDIKNRNFGNKYKEPNVDIDVLQIKFYDNIRDVYDNIDIYDNIRDDYKTDFDTFKTYIQLLNENRTINDKSEKVEYYLTDANYSKNLFPWELCYIATEPTQKEYFLLNVIMKNLIG